MKPHRTLIISVFIVASCGLAYELITAALASYLLGDSIFQYSLIIGLYLFSMGIGAHLTRYIADKDVLHRFIEIELLVGLIGGISALFLFTAFGIAAAPFRTLLYALVAVIGTVVGMEIPLVMRVLNEQRLAFKDTVARVLTFDYMGALAVSLLFPLFLAPKLGMARSALLFGLLNAAVALLTDESRIDNPTPMDWLGTSLLVVAVGSALIAIDQAGKLAQANWVLVLVLLVVAGVAFVAFWRQESASRHPLVTTTYLRSRSTWALLLTTMLTMTGVFAIMNGIVPALGQDADFGAALGADVVSFWTLTPYALAGLVMGPVAGTLAGRMGYHRVLRIGLIGTVAGLGLLLLGVATPQPWLLLVISILVGVTYAGMGNIMLNGLGIELSPKDNPGYLPGLNAGAFNLGAGISFAILYAVKTAAGDVGRGAYVATIIAGVVLLALAFLASLLIPRAAADGEAPAGPAGS